MYHEVERLHLDLNEFYTGTRARVLRCHNCQGYGHVAKDCTKPTTCVKCGKEGHKHWPNKNKICNEQVNCVHCKTEHQADSVECLLQVCKRFTAEEEKQSAKTQHTHQNIMTHINIISELQTKNTLSLGQINICGLSAYSSLALNQYASDCKLDILAVSETKN